MILSLTRQGRVPATVSYGVPGSDDLRLGAAVAGSVGLSHRALTLRPGYLAAWAPEAAWLFEGRFRCLACHHLSLRALCGDGVDSVLIGFSGDDVLRTAEDVTSKDVDGAFVRRVHSLRAGCLNDEMLSDVLTPRFASVLRGRAEAALHSELVHDVGEPAARFAQLRFRSTQSPTLFADYFPARDPFADHQLVDFARTIPWALRRNGRLERLFLQTDARLARLPTTHHRAPPSASALGVEVAAANARLRRRLRPWTSQRTGLGSYAADLRGASRSLLNMLVEPRTLERDQLDAGAAHRLVEGTLAGRITDMRPIGVLLTLELFQRQFVDGDAPPWDGDLPAALRAQIPVDGAGNKRLAHAS